MDFIKLSFLLSGDRGEAAKCFVAGIEDCVVKENHVFREWARTWAKRVIVENAIRELKPRQNFSLTLLRLRRLSRTASSQAVQVRIRSGNGVRAWRFRAVCFRDVGSGELFGPRMRHPSRFARSGKSGKVASMHFKSWPAQAKSTQRALKPRSRSLAKGEPGANVTWQCTNPNALTRAFFMLTNPERNRNIEELNDDEIYAAIRYLEPDEARVIRTTRRLQPRTMTITASRYACVYTSQC